MGQGGPSRAGVVRSIDAVLGSRLLAGSFRALTGGRLRILGYHGVSDRVRFESQMLHILDHYEPVGAESVSAAMKGGAVRDRSAWVTFDDADPSVVENALPVLKRLGIPATMFVCPGVVGTDIPYWWQIVEEYESSREVELIGATPREGWLAFLKRAEDSNRREVVDAMSESLTLARGSSPTRRQITVGELEEFAAHGTLGNHTWDHPCLDTCSAEEQTNQIVAAHEWLRSTFEPRHLLFAYPNGNHAGTSEHVLRDLGYDLATLFDHRLGRRDQNPLRLSRIRTSDTAAPGRYAALVSGVHPAAHRVRSHLPSAFAPGHGM